MKILTTDKMTLQDLERIAARCCLCELHKNRNLPVFAKGKNDFGLMIVGMVPGPEENKIGLPFVGPAGKLLDSILMHLNISPDTVYITNTVKCALAPGLSLKESWIDACFPFLMAQIFFVKPFIIVSLGADATNTLLGLQSGTPIGILRGRLYEWFGGIYITPTYHPSYLLRGGGMSHPHYAKVLADISLALNKIRTF